MASLQSLRTLCLCALLAIPLLGGTGCSAKAKVERHVKRADAYFAKQQFDAARIEYMNAFRLEQNNPHVAARLGESFLETGDLQRGFQLLAHARELQPTNKAVRVKLAALLLVGGDPKRAREEVEEILKTDPRNGEALVLLANSATDTNQVAEIKGRLEALLPAAPNSSSIHLALGVLAQKTADFPVAEAAFSRAVELDPKSPKANLALANVYFVRGNTNKADIHFKAANELSGPKSIERLSYVEFLTKTGRAPEAKKLLEATTASHPEFVSGWNMLTQIAFSESDTNSAAQHIAKALAHDPNNRDALLSRARMKLAARDLTAANTELQQLAEKFPRDSQVHHQLALAQLANDEATKAINTLDKAVALNTNNFDAIVLRAQAQISRGDPNSAIPELVRLTQQIPGAPQPHYLLAAALRQRGALEQAVAVYTNMTRIFPKDPQPYHLIGTIRRQQTNLAGSLVAARQSYEAALQVNPDYLGAIDDLIELDVISNRHADALARVQTYIEKYPDKPMPRLLQAKVLFAQNKNEEAETAVKKAIELDPEFYAGHRALADFYLRTRQTDAAIAKLESMVEKNSRDISSLLLVGMLYETKADYEKARRAYESLLKVNPNSIPALNNLAYILSERVGDIPGALQHARKARDLAPYNEHTADTFGWILYRQGEYQAALAPIQQAADRLPNQAEVIYHLGMVQYMLGASEPAAAALAAAVNSNEEFMGKDVARDALAILQIDPAKPGPGTAALLAKAVEKNPKDAFAWTRLAQLSETQGNVEKAREAYEQALRVNPRSAVLLSRLAVLNAVGLKNPAKGLEYAKQAWSISQNPDLAGTIGPVGYLAGDLRWANGVLLESQRSLRPSSEATFYFALVSYALGRVDQAAQAFNAVTRASDAPAKNVQLAKAGADLAGLHLGTTPPGQAEQAITTAQALDPQFPPALVVSGLVAEKKGDFTGARSKYEQALKAHPGFIIAQRQLAILLADKLADDARATELAAGLRSDFANDPELSGVLGKIAYRRGDYNDALRQLRTATLRPGFDSELLYYLGMSQFHLKDRAAKATLTRAIDERPNTTLTADARKALAELEK